VFVCPACQTENRPTAKFCRKCGLRRQGSDGSAVAVSPPAERAVEQVETAQAATAAQAGQDAGQPASASAAIAVSQTAVAADDAAEAECEEDFGEEITEEEVQKELDGKRAAGVAPAEAAQEAPGDDRVAAKEAQGQQDSPGAEQPRRGGHTCPSCGSNVRVTDKFCIWCGERQPQRIIPKMKRCSECRTQLPMTANFCFVCGNDVSLHLRRKVRVPSELFHEEDPELFPTFEA